MTKHPITTRQFAIWSALISLAFALLLVVPPLFILPIYAANFVIMPRPIPRQPVTLRHLLVALALLGLAAALIAWLVTHPSPEREAWERSFSAVFRSPAFAAPLWLCFLYLGYRRWRGKTPEQRELRQEPDPP
ncbi:hypothetical protein [Prosthecobacter sp.]|uniref:hypothetical protein n=1 Tax=Prosthecobacter sp. TaxID=1965333 RepID=UPI003783EFB9